MRHQATTRVILLGLWLVLPLGAVAADAPAPGTPALKNPGLDWESLPTIRTGVKLWSHTSKSPLNFTVMDWTNYTLGEKIGWSDRNPNPRGSTGTFKVKCNPTTHVKAGGGPVPIAGEISALGCPASDGGGNPAS